MFLVLLILVSLIGLQPVHQLIEVNLVAVEFGAIDAGKLAFAVDSNPAAPAHSRSVNHNRIQTYDSRDIHWPGQLRYRLHHYYGSRTVNSVHFRLRVFDKLPQCVCNESLFTR